MPKVEHIIEALGRHEDDAAVGVLENVGTNCPYDDIREMTAKALVRRNTHDSLKVVLINKGKGIHDLNSRVAMGTVDAILDLEDKSEVLKILDDTINMHSDEFVRENARSVKTLIELTN